MTYRPDVEALLRKHGVSIACLAAGIGRTVGTVEYWISGKYDPPRYIEFTIQAVAAKYPPVRPGLMVNLDRLGAPPFTIKYWQRTGQYPVAARLAVAYLNQAPSPDRLTSQDMTVLGTVIKAGKYFRVTGGWRARPIMGVKLRRLRPLTPTKLAGLGYLQIHNGVLTATEKGKKRWYR